jgi:hypothetical protein
MLKALKMRNITERIGHEFYPKVARCDGWEFRPAGAWILLITLPGATFPPLRCGHSAPGFRVAPRCGSVEWCNGIENLLKTLWITFNR